MTSLPVLEARTLPLDILPAGHTLFRIHPTERDPIFFGPAPERPLSGRWDAPDRSFGVCYLAGAGFPHGAFAERFLREPGRTLVPERELRRASLATLRLRREVTVVRFHGNGLARLGATAEVAHGDHRGSRPWALALHRHPARPGGIRWRARHDDDALAVALFDRERDSLEIVRSVPLLSAELAGEVAGWLDRYGIGVEEG